MPPYISLIKHEITVLYGFVISTTYKSHFMAPVGVGGDCIALV